eukprot:CAMPEP_0115276158 /NCGR_PEP_ID=MMETSP0270-20121206/56572_1 /TAXON_ID=71861 /ORGANISM="Scrippsiella trochoidea, Strain CCMP3099" /LENGTH=101 /DNA_ID=CAMNT_0002692743 /DNA_START=157 /DNA_END=462 /DNA_ORIENTATION=+
MAFDLPLALALPFALPFLGLAPDLAAPFDRPLLLDRCLPKVTALLHRRSVATCALAGATNCPEALKRSSCRGITSASSITWDLTGRWAFIKRVQTSSASLI